MKKYFLLLPLIIALLIPAQAGAVSNYDNSWINKSTEAVHLESKNQATGVVGEFTVDLTMFQIGEHLKDCSQSTYDSFVSSYNNTQDYLIITYGTKDRITFFWGDNGSGQINYTSSYSTPRFILDVLGTVNRADVVASPTGWTCSTPTAFNGVSVADPGSPSWIYGNAFPVIYPSGYEGLILPNTYSYNPITPIYPDFRYTIDINRYLNIRYSNNLVEIPYVSNDNLHKFVYTLIPTNDDYSVYDYNDKIDEQEINVTQSYNYQFENYGKYILMINFKTIIPGSNIEGVQQILIRLNVENGKFISGDTNLDTCTNGVCSPPNTDCGSRSNFLDAFTCQFNAQLSIGVINPSINAFKDLFSSMFVSLNPQCDFSMPNAPLPGGREFNSSGLATSICSTSDKVKTAFPILSAIANLAFSLMILSLVFRIINRIADLNNNDIVEGL